MLGILSSENQRLSHDDEHLQESLGRKMRGITPTQKTMMTLLNYKLTTRPPRSRHEDGEFHQDHSHRAHLPFSYFPELTGNREMGSKIARTGWVDISLSKKCISVFFFSISRPLDTFLGVKAGKIKINISEKAITLQTVIHIHL